MSSGEIGDKGQDRDQRRYVTILYSDICGSTRLGEAVDPEHLAHVVRAVKAMATGIVTRADGLVTQFHGDGILALFGYPESREDDIQRATEAALDLHRASAELELGDYLPDDFPLKLHTGIDSGLVLIRQGDFLDGTFELVGDAVNTAAGLCRAAREDEIIASAATLRGVSPFFVATELEPLELKGKRQRIAAYRVLRRSEVRDRYEASRRRGLTTFCGRRPELEHLRQHMQHARTGHPRIVQIVGDPGMGKTRLLDEFLAGAERECQILRGRCERRGSVAPLQPFLQMLRQDFDLDLPVTDAEARRRVAGRLAALDQALLAHADSFLLALAPNAAGATAGDGRPGLEQPLIDWLEAQVRARPMVVVVDDWQWADDASRKVLGQVLRAAGSSRLMVVTASRDIAQDDPVTAQSEIFQLQPMSQVETEQIVRTLMPGQLDMGVVAGLHRKSGGNPLFLEELCQCYPDWRPQDDVARVGAVVPATLQGLIESRVQRLPAEQIELVQTAAVIGTIIPFWLLSRLCGLREDDERLRQLAAGDMIYAGDIRGTLQFKHGITRETIYAAVGLQRRRALHNRIAEILEELGESGSLIEHYESLAYHFAGGASHLKALQYAELAGDKALASSSLDRARQQYEAAMYAIDHLPDSPDMQRRWIAISERWAQPCVYGPESAQLKILQRTVDFATALGDRDGLAHAYYWQGYISYVLGDQPAAIEFYAKALDTAREAGNDRLVAQVTATLGQSHAAACNYTDALRHLDEAIEAKRKHPTRARIRVGSSYALSCKSLVLGDMGDFGGAHECSEEAYAAVRGQRHEIEGSILNNHGTVNLWQGCWSEAIDLTDRSRAIAEHVAAPYLYACSSAINAYARWNLSGDGEAIDALRRAIAWVEDKGMLLYSSFFYAWISDALVRSGDFREASEYAMRALERARHQDRLGEAMACRSLATATTADPRLDLEPAERYLAMALRAAKFRCSPHETAITEMHLARLAESSGERDKADALRMRARQAFQSMAMTWHLAQLEQECPRAVAP